MKCSKGIRMCFHFDPVLYICLGNLFSYKYFNSFFYFFLNLVSSHCILVSWTTFTFPISCSFVLPSAFQCNSFYLRSKLQQLFFPASFYDDGKVGLLFKVLDITSHRLSTEHSLDSVVENPFVKMVVHGP